MFTTPPSLKVALLCSPNCKLTSLTQTLDQIKKEKGLSNYLKVIPTNNSYCQTLMKYNQAGLKVPDAPIFLVKIGNDHTKMYPLSSRDEVFEMIRKQVSVLEPPGPISSEGPQITSKVAGRKIHWEPNRFPKDGTGLIVKVKEGEILHFISPEDQLYDVTLATNRWEPIRRLIPRTHGLNETLHLDSGFKETTHMICSVGDNQKIMRLKLIRVPDSIKEVLKGIALCDDKGDEDSQSQIPQMRIGKVTLRNKPKVEIDQEDSSE